MKTKFILVILFLYGSLAFSQVKLADKFYEAYAYTKAVEFYEKAANAGDESEHVLTRLGDCHYNNSNSEQAEIWYRKAIDKYPKISPEFVFKYIQVLRSLERYEESKEWLKKFQELKQSDKRASNIQAMSQELYDQLTSTEGVYVNLYNLDINTKYSDFGGYTAGNKFYFASTKPNDTMTFKNRREKEAYQKLYLWNGEPYLELYEANYKYNEEDIEITKQKYIASNEINSPNHESTVTITKDGNTIYFTRNNTDGRSKISYDKEGTSFLKIYKATKQGNKWVNVQELPFNDDSYSCGHPTLSPDEKTMYFASDKPGGRGLSDIYKVAILDNGKFGEPVNLGSSINTEGKEMFPFIAQDSTLYFSSDGHINLGLLDIFKSNYLKAKDKKDIIVENMGAPFNSSNDDFGFFTNSDNQTGFFTSANREDGKGGDDIYGFGVFECEQYVVGTVLNSHNKEPIDSANVQLIDETGLIIEEITTDSTGTYKFTVECDKKYTLKGTKEDFKRGLAEFATTTINAEENLVDLNLDPLILNSEIIINPIFFDYNKDNIRPDAAFELENVVTVLQRHPKMHIKIEAHTDARGGDKYNMKLSDRRAKSTRDYILSRGIAQERIESAIGYGESQLLNHCNNENKNKCSEEEHQENRRSKFIITNDYD